jgi:hypothetical protein
MVGVVLAGLMWMLAGCDDPFSPTRSIVLPIVSLEAPASVAAGESFVARVSVQSGGCRRFTALESTRTASRLTVIARGQDSSGPDVACPGDIRTDVREVRVDPPVSDPFTVVANQPDGTTSTRVVRVQ